MGISMMRRKLEDDTVLVTTTSSSGSDYRKGNRTALSINSLAIYALVHSKTLPLQTNLELEWKMALVATVKTTPKVQQSAAAKDSPVVTTEAYTSAKLENKTRTVAAAVDGTVSLCVSSIIPTSRFSCVVHGIDPNDARSLEHKPSKDAHAVSHNRRQKQLAQAQDYDFDEDL